MSCLSYAVRKQFSDKKDKMTGLLLIEVRSFLHLQNINTMQIRI